jgi:hypothetical protein
MPLLGFSNGGNKKTRRKQEKEKQAGAELCQALVQVDLLAVFILQLNFRFENTGKVSFSCLVNSSSFQLLRSSSMEVVFINISKIADLELFEPFGSSSFEFVFQGGSLSSVQKFKFTLY